MKKILLYVGIASLCISTVYAGDTLKISAPPSIWVQQHGKVLTGPVIDLLESILDDFGITIAPVSLTWARAISDMKSGTLDMIPVIFYNHKRAAFMDFTVPYTEVPTVVFVPRGKAFHFTTLDDLKGKRGLMVRGDSISPEFEIFESQLNLTKLANYKQVFRMLGNNRADYAVAAKFGFLIQARKFDYENKIETLTTPIASRSLYFAFSKKSRFLKYLPIINDRLKRLQADGTIDRMVNETIRLASEK